jgi:hypothetical protein
MGGADRASLRGHSDELVGILEDGTVRPDQRSSVEAGELALVTFLAGSWACAEPHRDRGRARGLDKIISSSI